MSAKRKYANIACDHYIDGATARKYGGACSEACRREISRYAPQPTLALATPPSVPGSWRKRGDTRIVNRRFGKQNWKGSGTE